MAKRQTSKESSGNIYADLGFANPELEQAKATLAREIRSIIDIRGMTQAEAGELLGVNQADVSRITRGRLAGYSLDRLVTMLTRLSLDVAFQLCPAASGSGGQVSVKGASSIVEVESAIPNREAAEKEVSAIV